MTVTTHAKSFIETQFPVSKISRESYRERKAVAGQTLTGLGKWWGRKPLILVRAAILGLLMPASDNPKRDREIFLKILTMDEDGLWKRYQKKAENGRMPLKVVHGRLSPGEQQQYFETDSSRPRVKKGVGISRDEVDQIAFRRMTYDERLLYCVRPEEIDGPTPACWQEINEHLGTDASSISELVEQLGTRRFGHRPRVGDAFCGGGSIPFEAARIGCEAFGSDLSPVAALLTWAALNIIGGGPEVVERVQDAQRQAFEAVDEQITQWGIEHREPDAKTGRQWRADAYLYCTECTCPECGWSAPMAPSWVIAEKNRVIARLVPVEKTKTFDFEVIEGASAEEFREAAKGTVQDGDLVCPQCRMRTPLKVIRGDGRGKQGDTKNLLRPWTKNDITPRNDDILRERLYCVRWLDTWTDEAGKRQTKRHYLAPDEKDLQRDKQVLEIVSDRLDTWQKQGILPSSQIERGYNTNQPMRERGWMHWINLFSPRQLLINGLFSEQSESLELTLLLGRMVNANSRLSRWKASNGGGIGGGVDVFSNQALNTLWNYSVRPHSVLGSLLVPSSDLPAIETSSLVVCSDVRGINHECDLWITDPPYADAINYHELSEFFLAWYGIRPKEKMPSWYGDSKRSLAVRGSSDDFRQAMVECYRNLAKCMPEDGMQVVMFTHQDAGVWADLALILWASGLRVTGAWCIATETDTALKQGNYVQGTVLLILRKHSGKEEAFLDELYPQVEEEVKAQLSAMLELDDEDDPNFGDTDYQLAAYAAALRVLTSYHGIEDIDIAHELSKGRVKGETSPIERIIQDAVKTACDFLVPKGMDDFTWKTLTAEERFYLKGLDLESHGEYRSGAYQELARGFGLREYTELLGNTKANETRLKTPTEYGKRALGGTGFGGSLVRHVLFSIRETVQSGDAQKGKNWLRNEVPNYWSERQRLRAILKYLTRFEHSIPGWSKDAPAAGLVDGAVENDHA